MFAPRLLALFLLLVPALRAGGARVAPAPLEVRVLRGGKPLPETLVRWGRRYTHTDGSGRALLHGVPPGAGVLEVLSPGSDRLERELELAPGLREAVEVDLTPHVAAELVGRVVSRPGAVPVPGARLRLEILESAAPRVGDLELPSRADGNFGPIQVPAGRYRLVAEAPGFRTLRRELTLAAGDPPQEIGLELDRQAVTTRVRVLDARSGAPLAGARVRLGTALPIGLAAEATSGPDGSALLELHRGSFDREGPGGLLLAAPRRLGVVAEKPGYGSGATLVDLGDREPGVLLLAAEDPGEGALPGDPGTLLPGERAVLRFDRIGDVDVFEIPLPVDAELDLTLSAGPLETWIRLLDASGQVVLEGGGRKGREHRRVVPLRAGRYRLEASEWGRNSRSDEDFVLTCRARWLPDPGEPDDAAPASRALPAGGWMRGFVAPVGDVDRFRLDLERPSRVRLHRDAGPLEHYIQVRDPAGELEAQGGFRRGVGWMECTLGAGRHFLEVTEWGSNAYSPEPYLFRVEVIEDEGAVPELDGRRPLTVRPVAPLPGMVSGTILPTGDRDVFPLDIPSRGRLVVEVDTPLELWVEVRDEAGQALASSGLRRGKRWFQWDSPGPGRVHLVVGEWGDNGHSEEPYRLRLWHVPHGELDELDGNDLPSRATLIRPGEPLEESLFPLRDQDHFLLAGDHPARLHIDLELPLESWLRVTGPGEVVLWEGGLRRGRHSRNLPVPAGDVRLHLQEWGNNSASAQPYQLAVRLDRDDPGEVGPGGEDPARVLPEGVASQFSLSHEKDQDRFLVDLAGAGTVHLDLALRLEVWARVLDDRSGAVLYEGGLRRGGARARFEVGGPTRVRVELQEWGNNGWAVPAGFLRVSQPDLPLSACLVRARVDPTRPRSVTFSREALAGIGEPGLLHLDLDGDGTPERELPLEGEIRVELASEGRHLIRWEGSSGGGAVRGWTWVDATGPRPREGIWLSLLDPPENATLDAPRPFLARAASFSGAPLTGVALRVDGARVGRASQAPFSFSLPWTTLDRGGHRLELVARDSRGRSQRLERSFTKAPVFDLEPANGAVVSGEQVVVRWDGGAEGPSEVRCRKQGEEDWVLARGPSGRHRRVVLEGLAPGVPHEFQPLESGNPVAPVRVVTRVPGLAFGAPRYPVTIARDYDQRLGVSVRNHGEEPRALRVRAHPPAPGTGLLVGFVGEGSGEAPLVLAPGEERDLWLGLSAQDARVREVPVELTLEGPEGERDAALVAVTVRLPEVKLGWEELGATPDGLGRRLALVNRGEALSDVSVAPSTPELRLRPQVDHASLGAGERLELEVRPRLHEGFTSAEGVVVASCLDTRVEQPVAVALAEGEQLSRFEFHGGVALDARETSLEEDLLLARGLAGAVLNPASVDWSRHRENPEDLDGDGRPERWSFWDADEFVRWIGEDTRGDGAVDFVLGDVGGDGVVDHASWRREDGAWERTNVVEAWLEVGFRLPWKRDRYEPHDLEVLLDGRVVGRLEDRLPEGNESFRIPPTWLRFDAEGRPEVNRVEIRSTHLRGGHYVVGTDFRLKLRTTGGEFWAAGRSRDEARGRVAAGGELQGLVPDLALSSSSLILEGEPGEGRTLGVRVPVRNLGGASARDVVVSLARATPGGRPEELTRVTLPEILPGERAEVVLPWTARAGEHSLVIRVDPEGALGDPDSDNDRAVQVVTVPAAESSAGAGAGNDGPGEDGAGEDGPRGRGSPHRGDAPGAENPGGGVPPGDSPRVFAFELGPVGSRGERDGRDPARVPGRGGFPATDLQPTELPEPHPVPGVASAYPPVVVGREPVGAGSGDSDSGPAPGAGEPGSPGGEPTGGPRVARSPSRALPGRRGGGQLVSQVRKQDWYCTNRPRIDVGFQLPSHLRGRRLPLPGTEQYREMVARLLARFREQGVDTTHLERFQQILRARIARLEQGERLPDFFESVMPLVTDRLIAYQDGTQDWELAEWRDTLQARADAWYLRLLSSGDPELVLRGLRARAEALGQFDAALRETAEAGIEMVRANQKITAECVETLGGLVVPQVGMAFDLYTLATGRNQLTGEKARALDQVLRLFGTGGPPLAGRIFRDFPEFRPALEQLAEFSRAGGRYGVEALADRLKVEPEVIQSGLDEIWDALTRERHLRGNSLRGRADAASRAFAESAEGAADLRRFRADEAQARGLLDELERAAPGSPELEDVVRRLQGDKTAQRLINEEGLEALGKHGSKGFEDLEDLRRKAKQVVEGQWYRAADGEVGDGFRRLRDAADEAEVRAAREALGLTEGQAKRFREQLDETSRRTGIPADQIEVDPLFVTNKRPPSKGPKKTSFGRDRDVTYVLTSKQAPRGARPGQARYQLGDLDHQLSTAPYQRAIWRATGQGELPRLPDTGAVDTRALANHADELDQAVTSGQHLEAYNTGDVALDDFLDKGKLPTLTRIEDVRDAVTFKSTHWFEKARRNPDPTLASREMAEGMRQATKQWRDLVLPRARQYGLDPRVHVPDRLEAGMEVFQAVAGGKISASHGEHMLRALGTDPERLVKDMGAYLEALEKGAGVGRRRLRAMAVVNHLDHLREQNALWQGEGLRTLNQALVNGDLSGPQFLSLRSEVLRDSLADWRRRFPEDYPQGVPAWLERLHAARSLAHHELSHRGDRVGP